ncbi:unnamed protein product, partial [marine sediment metagenome]
DQVISDAQLCLSRSWQETGKKRSSSLRLFFNVRE